VNSFGLRKKNSLHIPSLLFSSFHSWHDNVGAPQIEGSIIYSTSFLRSKTLFFWASWQEKKNCDSKLWFEGNCTSKYMGM
jgi:hypothetical protein